MPLQHPSTSGTPDNLPTAVNELYANDLYLDGRITAQFALLSSVSYAAFGTTTGTVADGGALTAEITRAQTAEQTNATAIQAAVTAIQAETSRAQGVEALKANIASPTFTGTPQAPTAAAGTGGTQIATLDFVATAVAAGGGGGGGTGGVPTTRTITAAGLATGGGDLTANRTITVTKAAQSDVATGTDDTKALTSLSVAAALGAKAALSSPTFVGTPAAPTATAGTNTTQLATTAFVTAAVGSVQRTAFRYVATASQTTFSGADAGGQTLAYTVGLIQVYVNGRRLSSPDFTAPDGTGVYIPTGLNAGDELLVIADAAFSVANTYTQAQVNALIAALPAVPPPVRQTVLYGPTASGVPSFMVASNGSLSISTQNISASVPFTFTAAQGFSAPGAVDLVYRLTANVTWSGLTASAVNYLFLNASTGATSASTLAPIYQFGGTISTTSGQFTFDYQAMTGYLGNGATAPATPLVCVAEATATASAVVPTTAYAYQGRYQSGVQATTASGVVTFTHNLGLSNELIEFTPYARGTSTGNPWMQNPLAYGSVPYNGLGVQGGTPRLSIKIANGSVGTFIDNNSGTGTTAASVDFMIRARRAF